MSDSCRSFLALAASGGLTEEAFLSKTIPEPKPSQTWFICIASPAGPQLAEAGPPSEPNQSFSSKRLLPADVSPSLRDQRRC